MPTMLHLEDDISNAVKIVNNAKIGSMIFDNDMKSLACAVNGSFVWSPYSFTFLTHISIQSWIVAFTGIFTMNHPTNTGSRA